MKEILPSSIFIGRFNPPTRGHELMIDMFVEYSSKNNQTPILFIINGGKSSLDKRKNPLTFLERKKILHEMYPTLRIEEAFDAYQAIELLEYNSYYPVTLFCGEDRKSIYSSMLKNMEYEDTELKSFRRFKEAGLDISASILKNKIIKDDYRNIRSYFPFKLSNNTIYSIIETIKGPKNT